MDNDNTAEFEGVDDDNADNDDTHVDDNNVSDNPGDNDNIKVEEVIDNNDPPQEYHTSGRPKLSNMRHIKDTPACNTYTFAIEVKAQVYDLDEGTPTITVFLHAQTACVNSLETYK